MGGSFHSGLFHGTQGSPQLKLDLDVAAEEPEAPSRQDDTPAEAPPSVTMRELLMAQATTPEAREVINQLYRPGAYIGDGGTADAIREELSTGKPIGDRFHSKKGRERIRQIKRILRKNPKHPDRELLEKLLKGLEDALGGRR